MNVDPTAERPIVHAAPRVRMPLAAVITGLSEKAMRRKIEEGKWLEGRQYHRDPDGNVWIDIPAVMIWVGGGR